MLATDETYYWLFSLELPFDHLKNVSLGGASESFEDLSLSFGAAAAAKRLDSGASSPLIAGRMSYSIKCALSEPLYLPVVLTPSSS